MIVSTSLLLKLRCFQLASLDDRYTDDDMEHDQFVVEAALDRVERINRRIKQGGK